MASPSKTGNPRNPENWSPNLLKRMQQDTCYVCNQVGHWSWSCPLKSPSKPDSLVFSDTCRCGYGSCEFKPSHRGRKFFASYVKRGHGSCVCRVLEDELLNNNTKAKGIVPIQQSRQRTLHEFFEGCQNDEVDDVLGTELDNENDMQVNIKRMRIAYFSESPDKEDVGAVLNRANLKCVENEEEAVLKEAAERALVPRNKREISRVLFDIDHPKPRTRLAPQKIQANEIATTTDVAPLNIDASLVAHNNDEVSPDLHTEETREREEKLISNNVAEANPLCRRRYNIEVEASSSVPEPPPHDDQAIPDSVDKLKSMVANLVSALEKERCLRQRFERRVTKLVAKLYSKFNLDLDREEDELSQD
ncbi:hypothetical protein Fmac_029372 [Flemingia macrophylla]|uniref:CCHC-type domain-containing protein n=1 Tax=Flemingia macrophylla TaxID=520843 RepID=A0ABD1LAP3_9FABA